MSGTAEHSSLQSNPIDLRRVRALFSRPDAVSGSAFLRREVAARMLERLQLVRLQPQALLDAGCGEGADLSLLSDQFPNVSILGLDATAAMIDKARHGGRRSESPLRRMVTHRLLRDAFARRETARFICADFAQLPLAQGCVDLIWSNLALHWHPSPHRVFEEWRRVLRVDGLLMFSCFGPDTFKELRAALGPELAPASVLSFVDMHDFGDMLVDSGFSTPVMDMETITVTYGDMEKLLEDVRAFGGNPLQHRRRGLLGRRTWERVRDKLSAACLPDGRIPLTFEIIYGHAFRPAPKTTRTGETIIRFEPRGK